MIIMDFVWNKELGVKPLTLWFMDNCLTNCSHLPMT